MQNIRKILAVLVATSALLGTNAIPATANPYTNNNENNSNWRDRAGWQVTTQAAKKFTPLGRAVTAGRAAFKVEKRILTDERTQGWMNNGYYESDAVKKWERTAETGQWQN